MAIKQGLCLEGIWKLDASALRPAERGEILSEVEENKGQQQRDQQPPEPETFWKKRVQHQQKKLGQGWEVSFHRKAQPQASRLIFIFQTRHHAGKFIHGDAFALMDAKGVVGGFKLHQRAQPIVSQVYV